MLVEQRHADAVAEIERVEQELLETVSEWRRLLHVVPAQAFDAEMKERAFANPEDRPAPPDFRAAEIAHRVEVERAVCRELPLRGWTRFLWVLVGLASLVVGAPFNIGGGILLAGPAALTTGLVVYGRWLTRLRPVWEERARGSWPAVRSALAAQYAGVLADYDQRERTAGADWVAADQRRIAGLHRPRPR